MRQVEKSDKVWIPKLSPPVVSPQEVDKMTRERKNRRREIVSEELTNNFRPPLYPVQSAEFKKPWTPMGKSCFVTLKMREEADERPQVSAFVKQILLRKKKIEDSDSDGEEQTTSTKRKWCAAPFGKSRSTYVSEHSPMRCSPRRAKKQKTNPLQRGKWILQDSKSHITDAWKNICYLITEGTLEKCNAKLQGYSEVWLYCNIGDAEKVSDILQEKLLIRSRKSGTMGSWTWNYQQKLSSL